MRHRLRKSHQNSISSTKSGKSDASPRPSLDQAPKASASASTPAQETKTAMAAAAASSPAPAMASSNRPAASDLTRSLSTIRAVTHNDDRLLPQIPPQHLGSLEDELSDTSLSGTPSALSSPIASSMSTSSSSFAATTSNTPSSASARLNGSLKPGAASTGASSSSFASMNVHTVMPSGYRSASHSSINNSTSNSHPAEAGDEAATAAATAAASNGNWDATIGKAGLGKTGRVINRLVSDNEALKRDLQIERLKADEARQAARLLEDKMERLVSEYESRLLEANVTKTLLARKERQVESLLGTVELEKKRTTDALERERTWRDEMERVRADAQQQVDEASARAALMDGRYTAISSHWRDQGDMVKQAMERMGVEIRQLVEAREQDDGKIAMLRDLCDQQDSNIKLLWQQKEAIGGQFEAYKREQEDALRDIKSNAAAREAEQQRMLEEAREVLAKLKWALNVKQTIAWAE